MTKTITKQEKEPALLQIAQKAILYRPDTQAFLLLKGRNGGPWDFLGGRLHVDEPLRESLEREIKEEAGEEMTYEVREVVGTSVVRYETKPITVLLLGYLAMFREGEIRISEEHTEYRWETEENIEKSDEYLDVVKEFVKAAGARLKEQAYLTDLQRLQADFENFKKHQITREKEIAGYLIEKLVMDLVPVLDNFRMATEHVPEEQKTSPWVTGIQYIEKQLEKVLTENGVTTIEVKVGDIFDPTIHEAIEREQTAEGEQTAEQEDHTETITKILQNGFKIGERVIRPAKVTVK